MIGRRFDRVACLTFVTHTVVFPYRRLPMPLLATLNHPPSSCPRPVGRTRHVWRHQWLQCAVLIMPFRALPCQLGRRRPHGACALRAGVLGLAKWPGQLRWAPLRRRIALTDALLHAIQL